MSEAETIPEMLAALTPDGLSLLDEMMARGPGQDASDGEIEAFMTQLLADEGGSQLVAELIHGLKESGLSSEIKTEKGSSLSLVFRTSSETGNVRVELPSDCRFSSLRAAILKHHPLPEDKHSVFELSMDGEEPVVIGGLEGDAICDHQNRVSEVLGSGFDHFVLVFLPDREVKVRIYPEGLVRRATS